ncbi:hypothetical protein PPL_10348 [Heterostelium album PN500]|uniref:Uncharacterized protein n=1 Tax=Heterostelium pallidum (strain ATCC 26659 / Pp 5 / PN500) TaxID=670386 RepID=D3BQ28_HETP5|nr:hypothetical protein PPL_10348 [Heterostelium album PN500]EFA76579.1 hypothetical protein PPL_10348 [Heterostelium album PN500]|eukprot:XP_020428711.1 hypothetical protein PPL_10348 [Heterostelium album PN500]
MNINSGMGGMGGMGGMPTPPPGWQISMDNMGRLFYFNPMTQQQSWVPPPGSGPAGSMPIGGMGATTSTTGSGGGMSQSPKPFNVSSLASSKSSLSSSSLPEGWEEATDNQGRVYYIDHINKKTSWIHPNFSQQLHQQQQQQQPISIPQQQHHHQQPIASSPPASSDYPSIQPKKQNDTFYPSMAEYGYNIPSSSLPGTLAQQQQPKQPVRAPEPQRQRTSSAPQVPLPTIVRQPIPKSTTILSQTAPLWDLEKTIPACANCYLPFTVIRRRHHCRCCQREFCDACSQKRIAIPQFNHLDPVRVCIYCFIHTTDHDKTCISRLVPYFLDFHRDLNHQYQALVEIYDFLLSNQNNAEKIDCALVGGLKPFLEYISRMTKENHKSDTLTIACQILSLLSKYEKLLKTIQEPEYIATLFDLMSCTDIPSIKLDCARLLKNIVSNVDKNANSAANQGGSSAASSVPPSPATPATPASTAASPATTPALETLKLSNIVTKSHIVQIVSLLETPISKEEFQLELLKILRILAHDEESLTNISQSNAIEAVTPLLSSTRPDILKSVLKILTRLSILDKKNAEKLYSVGGVIFLLEIVTKQIVQLNNILIRLLYSLSKTKLCANAIASSEAGVGAILFLYSNSTGNAALQEPILLLLDQILEYNPVKQLHVLISSNDAFIKTLLQSFRNPTLEPLALSIFNQLCLTDQSKESLRTHGLIEPILSMMCDKSKNIVLPLEILSRIALNNEKACYNIFEVGGISVLIDIMTTPPPQVPKKEVPVVNGALSPLSQIPYSDLEEMAESTYNADLKRHELFKKVQYNTVKLVGNLSHSKNIVQEFVHFEDGAGVKALVALLNPSVDESVKQVASEALSNLCENEACSILVLSEGGLTYSMALLSSSNTLIKTNALRLLQRLASHSPEIKFVISEGASIRQIVEMLSNQSPDVKKCAIFSLAELCKDNESNREQAFKFGCLGVLVQAFNSYVNDPKTLVCLLEIVSGFAGQSDQYRSVLLGTNIVQCIIEYLFQSMSAQDDNFVIQSQVFSVLILSQMIRENMGDQIRKIIDSGIILSLVPLLAVKNSYLQEYTLTVLNTISRSSSSDLRESLMSSGPILASLSELLTSKNESILLNSLSILLELSKSPECGGYLLSTNAISQISELIISPSTPQPVKSLAIHLISSLFSSNSNNANIWEIFTNKAGIPGLVALLSSTNIVAQVTSANALSAIVVDGPGRARVVESGGLPALVNALSSSNVNVACAVLVTILGLSLEDELCELIVNLGALNPLLNILSNPEFMSNNINIDAKLYSCETIFNLASNQQCRALICDTKLISQLLDLLFIGNEQYKVVACKTLAVLAADPNTAKMVCEQGGIMGLVPLLSSPSSDENTIMSAAIALTNLGRFNNMAKNHIITSINDQGVTGLDIIISILSIKEGVKSSQKIKLQLLDLLTLCSDDASFATVLETLPNAIPNLLSLLSASLSQLPTANTSLPTTEASPKKELAPDTNQLMIVFKTLSIVITVSNNPKIRNQLVEHNCLKSVSMLLSPPPEQLVSLDSLSSSISLLDMPTKEPEPQQRVNLDSIEEKEEVNKQCLNLVYTFSFSESGKTQVRNSKLLPIVQRFLDSKMEDQVCIALRTMYNLSISNINRVEINSNGGMDKILDIFTKTSNPNIVLNSLCTLYNLMFLSDNFNLFIKRDCFKILSQCINYPNEGIQLWAIMIINRHLNTEKYSEILANQGVISGLLTILSTASSENLILYVLKTLNDMSPYDHARKLIENQIPVEILKAIQTVPNTTIRELAESLLRCFGQ